MKKTCISLLLILALCALPVLGLAGVTGEDAAYDPLDPKNRVGGVPPQEQHVYEADPTPLRAGFFSLRPTADPRYINALLSQEDHTRAQVSFYGNYALCDSSDKAQFRLTEGYVYTIAVKNKALQLQDARGNVLFSDTGFYMKEYAPSAGQPANYFKVADVSNGSSPSDRIYQGQLNCHYQAATGVYEDLWTGLYLINRIYIEDYIKGVLPAEIGSATALEAQKAQAVVCRNFAVGSKRSTRIFDVYDYNRSQVYFGVSYDNALTDQAVEETAGQVLTYKGEVIHAYFGATNGGYTELSMNQWSGTENCGPESVRYDEYDVATSRYRESVTLPKAPKGTEKAVVSLIENALIPNVKELKDLSADDVTVAGLSLKEGKCYTTSCRHHLRDKTEGQVCNHFCSVDVTFTGVKAGKKDIGDVTVNLKDIDFYVQPANGRPLGYFQNGSLGRYWLTSDKDSFTITHARYGHGVGLSQQSAINRAAAGQKAKEMLAFFFPDCTLAPHTGLGAADTLPALPAKFQQDIRILGKDTYVYAMASTKSLIRGILSAESGVRVLSAGTSWAKISYNGADCYIPAGALTRTYAKAAVDNVSDSLFIRKDLSGSGKVTVYPGSSYTLLKANAALGWHKIKYNNQEYYMAARYSALVPGTASALSPQTVTVTLPTGYTDTCLWLDGVPYNGTLSGSKLTAKVFTKGAKTAVMYKYDAKGIPTGMAVWRLTLSGNTYTAKRLAAFDDLLSYHGFSVRISGSSGIRFKSGISSSVKAALTGAGVEGYKLAEYGTVAFNHPDYYGAYPFVIDSSGALPTAYGRSYYTEGNTTYDYVVETVSGRVRFASVRVDIPDDQLDTDFIFRSFITLTQGGEKITVYGPPMSRSIYALADSFMSKGTYAADSPEGIFLQRIIDQVEGKN